MIVSFRCLPSSHEDVAEDILLFDDGRDDVLSEILRVVIEGVLQHFAIENINAHRCLKPFLLNGEIHGFEQFRGHHEFVKGGVILSGLLDEPGNAVTPIGVHQAERTGRLTRHRGGGNRNVGSGFAMLLEHLPEVHPVKLVTAENEEVFVRLLQEITQILAHGVCGPLIPVIVAGSLLGGEDVNKVITEVIELVTTRDVPVERLTVKLGQHIHFAQSRVDAIADRYVNNPVLSREGHRRLRPVVREGEEA